MPLCWEDVNRGASQVRTHTGAHSCFLSEPLTPTFTHSELPVGTHVVRSIASGAIAGRG